MRSGIISALDLRHRFGLIDADDGRILPFSCEDFVPPLWDLEIGTRVEFLDSSAGGQTRATEIRLPDTPEYSDGDSTRNFD